MNEMHQGGFDGIIIKGTRNDDMFFVTDPSQIKKKAIDKKLFLLEKLYHFLQEN